MIGRLLERESANADWLWMSFPEAAFARAELLAASRRCVISWDWDSPALWNATAVSALTPGDPVHAGRHGLQLLLALAYERRRLPAFDFASVPSPREQAWLGRWAGLPVEVLRNFVDVPAGDRAERPRLDVLFVGSDFAPNRHGLRWLLDRVWPQVRAAEPSATLTVVGRGMTEQRLGPVPAGVEMVGMVPDTEPYYASARCFVAPVFFGGGTQNKVLEAGAAGLPVVTTPYTARTVGSRGDGLVVATDAKAWSEAIVALLRERERARSIGEAGREIVASEFSRCAWIRDMERIEQRALRRRR